MSMTTNKQTLREEMREKFERWWELNYHNGNHPRFGWECWRDGDGYRIDDDESELDGMWESWQAAHSVKLEAAERRNAELEEKQRLIDICQGQGLEHRIAAEQRAEAAEKKLDKLIDILDWHTIELGCGEKPITLAELIVAREGADSLSAFRAAATDKGE